MSSRKPDRRRFLKEGAALAGLTLGAAGFAKSETPAAEAPSAPEKDLHAYGERSHYVTSVRVGNNNGWGKNPKPNVVTNYGPLTPLQDSVGIVTPSALHYIVSPPGNEPPDINPAEHRLMVHGMVDHPLIFTLDELQRLPSVTRFHFLQCRGNGDPNRPSRGKADSTVQLTHGLTSCSEWTGVTIALLLKEAGMQRGAKWIVGEGMDQSMHTKSVPMEKALDDCLVAYAQNGEPVRPEQGYPLRLLVPGFQGINNVKWLRRIKVTDAPYMGRRESTQYPELRPDGISTWFQSQFGTNSVITRPSGGQRLPGPGFYEITGLAWSGQGAIKRVEVSTDDGKTWKDAEIQGPVHRKAHTRFRYGWNWNGEEVTLRSRSTDETDEVQPTLTQIAELLKISEEWIKNPSGIFGNFNVIQVWKINRDGSIQNAIFA